MSIERIRAALAAGPTPGPWKIRAERYRFIHVYATGGGICQLDTVDGEGAANAKLIAAASPDNIAALLDRLDAAERECERLRDDAERLDWIASIARINSRHGTGYVMAIEVPISGPHHFLAYSNDDVRAAIDAAMAKDQK